MQYVATILLFAALAFGKTTEYGSVFVPNALLVWLALVALCLHVLFGV